MHSAFSSLTQHFTLFVCLLLSGAAMAQKTDSLAFPASWAGDWAGVLEIFNSKGLAQKVDMELSIQKIDTSRTGRYTFGITYGSKSHDWRPYELVPVDPAKGAWRIDEKNSIIMETYLYGPKLLCWFSVMGNRLLSTYEKRGDQIIFEIYSGSDTAISATGNTTYEGETIPEVKTYPMGVYQRAVLLKR